MKKNQLFMTAIMALVLFMAGCKPKDSEIQAAVQAKEAAGIFVAVTKGDVTLTGEVADEGARAQAETIAKAEKGVKSVVNNLKIKLAVQPVEIAADTLLIKNVTDAVKDFPTVIPTVKDGVVTLNGEISRASLITLMQHISALKPKKIENKLTVK